MQGIYINIDCKVKTCVEWYTYIDCDTIIMYFIVA